MIGWTGIPRAWTRIVTSASEIYVSHTNVATLTRVILWGWGSEQENSAIQFTVYCIHICIKTKRHAVSRFQIRLAIAIKIWWKLRKSAARLRRGRLHSFDTCTGHITNLVTGRRHSRKNSFSVEAFSTDHSWGSETTSVLRRLPSVTLTEKQIDTRLGEDGTFWDM